MVLVLKEAEMAVEQNDESVEIFLHGKGAPQVVVAFGSLTLREVLVRYPVATNSSS